MSIIELRQYTLVPGRREALIELFHDGLHDAQEECGMEIVGTFRDLDDERRFVWLRRFASMQERGRSLQDFYGGPVWKRSRDAANATMVDSDDVLMLRPGWPEADFAPGSDGGPAAALTGSDRGAVAVAVLSFADAVTSTELRHFSEHVAPELEALGGTVLACLVTEQSRNNFPQLPVREGEHVLVAVVGFPGREAAAVAADARATVAAAAGAWPDASVTASVLRLEPTEDSRLTGSTPAARPVLTS